VERLERVISSGRFQNGVDDKAGYRRLVVDGTSEYYYQLEDVNTAKPGKYQTKVIHAAFLKYMGMHEDVQGIDEKIQEIALHNTRNIHNSAIERLKTTLDYRALMNAENKVDHILEVVGRNPLDISRDLLSALKSLEQVTFDYDVIDFIALKRPLEEKDLTDQRLHTLLVLAYYIYDRDFEKRSIKVQIEKTQAVVRVSFLTVRSALALLFENCVKYCRPGTSIDIDYNITPSHLKVDIDMESVYNDVDDVQRAFLPGERGKLTSVLDSSGQGYGLYAARQMLSLNEISVDFRVMPDTRVTTHRGVRFCRNLFVIDIPLHRVVST
jgi:signal transduction histidine kinase